MRPYTFYMHDSGRGTPAFDFVQCDDDDDAVEHARTLLSQFAEYEHIEVFDGRDTRLDVRREPNAAAHWEEWAGF